MKASTLTAFARVARSAASVLTGLIPLERDLRVLAATLEENDGQAKTTRQTRPASSPVPTVEFTALDAKKADRALARLGIRNRS